ncbi:MAG: phytoene/squalene synthase family protein [Chitinophagaceae bacterium]|nr:phytoene/squalene synthase family protein [Chitinophagaceae bacterium]
MKALFDSVSVQCSKLTTHTYSTSFSLGIYFLQKRMRDPIYSIYGFVRFADEIVDSFDGYNKKRLLQQFKDQTYDAILYRISLNPILNSFQQAFHQYKISPELIETFLHSMEIDLYKKRYTAENYEQYIYGSAEVVGLMCLHVFSDGDVNLYNELKPFAMKLGAAFQKVNFLRDIQSDYQTLGRTYFPNVELTGFTGHAKKEIEKEIENDFKESLSGIKKLPVSSRGGVYLAYVYYNSLFKKIKKIPAERVMTERVRVSNSEKMRLMLNSMFQYKLNLL